MLKFKAFGLTHEAKYLGLLIMIENDPLRMHVPRKNFTSAREKDILTFFHQAIQSANNYKAGVLNNFEGQYQGPN